MHFEFFYRALGEWVQRADQLWGELHEVYKKGRLTAVREASYSMLLKSAGCMSFLLAWAARWFFIVVPLAQKPVLEIRISMTVVGCRGRYGRRK